MYTANWNMPGYLPNCETQEFDNLQDAKDFLIAELEGVAECFGESGNAYFAINEILALEPEVDVYESAEVLGQVFWIYKR